MKLLTISNLYPRPDRPQAGLFNAQLFRELGACLATPADLQHVTLVPEWRPWRWRDIRQWESPFAGKHPSIYWPVFYAPRVGRNCSAATYAWSMRGLAVDLQAADVILASWLYPDGVAVLRAAASVGKPAWVLALGSDVQHLRVPARRAAIVSACQLAAGVLCVGRHLATALLDAGVPRARLHVVPNGVDTAVFRHRLRDAARQECLKGPPGGALPPGARIILFAGNLVPVKNPVLLVEALAQLAEPQDVHVVMIGAGPLEAAVKRAARARHVSERVHLIGRQAHTRIAQWMNAADCLCLCSTSEGMPNVILEALASGLPVVATDVGACRDMLAGEPAASLVPSGDAAALARALHERLTDPADRTKMAARHGQRTWRDQARDILGLMRRAGTPST